MEATISAAALSKKINDILNRGNTVEFKKRKDDLIIIEVQRKIKETVVTNG